MTAVTQSSDTGSYSEDTAHMGLFREEGGGGFLNGVSGVIAGYKFGTKDWPGKPGKEGYSTLSAELTVLPDGATVPLTTYIPAGFFYPETMALSADGTAIETDDRTPIRKSDEWARFIGSMIEAKPELEAALEPAEGKSFEPIVGYRVTFAKKIDEEATKKFGKRKDKKDASKSYNRDYLVVTAVHEKGAVKAAAKGVAAPKAAAAGKKTAAPAVADTTMLDSALTAILTAAADQTVKVSGINSAVVRLALTDKTVDREAVRKGFTPAYFEDAQARDLIVISGEGKEQALTLV